MAVSTNYLKQLVYFREFLSSVRTIKAPKLPNRFAKKFCKVDQYENLSINFVFSFSCIYSIIYLKNTSNIHS